MAGTMNFLVRILITALAAFAAAYLLPGVHINQFSTALLLALVLALLNGIIRPVLVILTLPITIFSLGFFLLVINALIILMASHFVKGFTVDGFWWALFFSILLSVLSSLMERLGRKGEPAEEEI